MNKITEEQLKKCIYADVSSVNENTDSCIIKKYTKPQYISGHCYLIKLPREIINNPNTILATNWNNGNSPQHEYYKAYISKTVGKMIYVDCLAFDWNTQQDLNYRWSGYLDIDTLTQIGEVR